MNTLQAENVRVTEVSNQSFPLVRLIHFERSVTLDSYCILKRLQEHIGYEGNDSGQWPLSGACS